MHLIQIDFWTPQIIASSPEEGEKNYRPLGPFLRAFQMGSTMVGEWAELFFSDSFKSQTWRNHCYIPEPSNYKWHHITIARAVSLASVAMGLYFRNYTPIALLIAALGVKMIYRSLVVKPFISALMEPLNQTSAENTKLFTQIPIWFESHFSEEGKAILKQHYGDIAFSPENTTLAGKIEQVSDFLAGHASHLPILLRCLTIPKKGTAFSKIAELIIYSAWQKVIKQNSPSHSAWSDLKKITQDSYDVLRYVVGGKIRQALPQFSLHEKLKITISKEAISVAPFTFTELLIHDVNSIDNKKSTELLAKIPVWLDNHFSDEGKQIFKEHYADLSDGFDKGLSILDGVEKISSLLAGEKVDRLPSSNDREKISIILRGLTIPEDDDELASIVKLIIYKAWKKVIVSRTRWACLNSEIITLDSYSMLNPIFENEITGASYYNYGLLKQGFSMHKSLNFTIDPDTINVFEHDL